ncbi:MAG TPA: Sec-independent protein translocase protein TatB [Burkholderiaceae bacterium]|jgi:sec-independent protein translocase protein TatB|nr:Sec-independent protein translocase protein TatB [Burkholderiaceae bacterium]
MFDFAFTEMVVIALIALIVVGPERLPKLARQAGEWLGKMRRYVDDVKTDINRQMELQELRNLQSEVQQAAQSLESSMNTTLSEVQSDFDAASRALDPNAAPAPAALTEPATDWDRVYAQRRLRERIKERRRERDRELGVRRPKRPLH